MPLTPLRGALNIKSSRSGAHNLFSIDCESKARPLEAQATKLLIVARWAEIWPFAKTSSPIDETANGRHELSLTLEITGTERSRRFCRSCATLISLPASKSWEAVALRRTCRLSRWKRTLSTLWSMSSRTESFASCCPSICCRNRLIYPSRLKSEAGSEWIGHSVVAEDASPVALAAPPSQRGSPWPWTASHVVPIASSAKLRPSVIDDKSSAFVATSEWSSAPQLHFLWIIWRQMWLISMDMDFENWCPAHSLQYSGSIFNKSTTKNGTGSLTVKCHS